MRNIIFFVALLLMGAGCAKQDEGEAATAVVAAPEVAETAADDGPDAYYEYLW